MSARQVHDDIASAGLECRMNYTRDRGIRVEVRIGKTNRCIGALLPTDESLHMQFAKGLIEEARVKTMQANAGVQPVPIGTQKNISYDNIKLVERAN